jgi:hypothetical protein
MVFRKFLCIFILCCFFIGCGAIKLVDIQESSSALQLTDKQKQIIQPKLEYVSDIVEDYDFEKQQLESDLRGYRIIADDRQLNRMDGGLSTAQRQRTRNQMRIKARKFLSQRNTFLREIEKLLREIIAELTAEQRVTFGELKMPELEIPQMLKPDPHADLRYIPRNPIGME